MPNSAGGNALFLQPRDALAWMEAQTLPCMYNGIHQQDQLPRSGFVRAFGEPLVCGLDLVVFAVEQREATHGVAF